MSEYRQLELLSAGLSVGNRPMLGRIYQDHGARKELDQNQQQEVALVSLSFHFLKQNSDITPGMDPYAPWLVFFNSSSLSIFFITS